MKNTSYNKFKLVQSIAYYKFILVNLHDKNYFPITVVNLHNSKAHNSVIPGIPLHQHTDSQKTE